MKKKLLYFSQVQWNWIKQRPHFIAEELSKYYDVTVVLRKGFSNQDTQNETSLTLKSFKRLPFERLGIVSKLNSMICRFQTRKLQNSSDILWLTYPHQYNYLDSGTLKNKTIVYDCMDDMMEFTTDEGIRNRIFQNEKKLYERANYIFCSSDYLKNKLIARYGERPITVVNNAITSNIGKNVGNLSDSTKAIFEKYKEFKTATYIGTISEWMDFDIIMNTLNTIPELVVLLFGPVRTQVPIHDRLICCGSVNHDEVFTVMENSDMLIMPFILNELILSVNPVKLYEYIYSGKPCIAPLYGESVPFKGFVHLYSNEKEFNEIVNGIISSDYSSHNLNECHQYALNNTWEKRVDQMMTILSSKYDR